MVKGARSAPLRVCRPRKVLSKQTERKEAAAGGHDGRLHDTICAADCERVNVHICEFSIYEMKKKKEKHL